MGCPQQLVEFEPMHPFGEYVYNVLKYRKVAAVVPDFAFGWETLGGFQRSFEELGGKIIQDCGTPWSCRIIVPISP